MTEKYEHNFINRNSLENILNQEGQSKKKLREINLIRYKWEKLKESLFYWINLTLIYKQTSFFKFLLLPYFFSKWIH